MNKDGYKELYGKAIAEISELKKKIEILEGTYRGDEWKIEQFNRNRSISDQVKTIEEMNAKVKEIFGEKK